MTRISVLFLCGMLSPVAAAQFTGPGSTGQAITAAQVRGARLGSYVTVTGYIVAHQRQNYYTFRDGSGDIRVEIENPVWQGRPVAPETKVRLLGEVDQGIAGRFLWIKSLEVVK